MDCSEVGNFGPLDVADAWRKGIAEFGQPDPISFPAWAEKYFYLSRESSYGEGAWKAWPFQPAIMACMANDDIEEVDVEKSARIGYTKMFLALLCYNAHHRRRNQAVWQPTDDDRDEFVKTELEPALRDVEVMRDVFPEYLSRSKKNTMRQKILLGSMMHMRGGKAAKNYRRISVDVAALDEIDGFDQNIENEGAPFDLAKKRVEGATFPKVIVGSTPKLKGFSHIEARADAAPCQLVYQIPCPHCGELHPITWGARTARHGMKWVNADPATVRHLCPNPDCGALISQAEYLSVWHLGIYVSADGIRCDREGVFTDASGAVIPAPRHVAFRRVWTAYSPAASWEQIVREYLEARQKAKTGDPSSMQSFTNLTLGQSYEANVEKTDATELIARAEAYPLRRVPNGGLVLVAGVDVQDNRFEIVVWAIGRGFESWPIDYTVLRADPANWDDWRRLDAYLTTRFPHEIGQPIGIDATAIDTGGHFTHFVYEFVRTREARRIFAVKGESRDGQPIVAGSGMVDVNAKGKVIKNGLRLWRVGTDTAKDLIFSRLRLTQPGPGYIHLSKELPPEFFEQLTNEQRVEQTTARGTVSRWVKKSSAARVEVLDCTNYALFAAHRMDLHRWTEAMWDRQALAVCPPMADLFEPAPSPDPLPPVADAPLDEIPQPPDQSPPRQRGTRRVRGSI